MADMRSPIVCCLGAAWSECLPLTVAGWTMDNRREGGLRSGRVATMGLGAIDGIWSKDMGAQLVATG